VKGSGGFEVAEAVDLLDEETLKALALDFALGGIILLFEAKSV
jgi:hypothetical protein